MGYEVKDSGKRSEFQTGAVRDIQDDKGRFDLLPPEPIWALAIHYQKGSKKYGDRNWEKGIPLSRYYDSATRHLMEFWMGLDDENHLIAAIWNLCGLYATKMRIQLGLLPKELDDMPIKCTLPDLPRSKK
jgi:hypothetical protein